jgi:hypothetical protein
MQTFRWENSVVILRRHDGNRLRLGTKNSNHQIIPRAVRSEDTKGIGMRAMQDGGNIIRIDRVNGKQTHPTTLGMPAGFATSRRRLKILAATKAIGIF